MHYLNYGGDNLGGITSNLYRKLIIWINIHQKKPDLTELRNKFETFFSFWPNYEITK